MMGFLLENQFVGKMIIICVLQWLSIINTCIIPILLSFLQYYFFIFNIVSIKINFKFVR